jgi:hypothetical protein
VSFAQRRRIPIFVLTERSATIKGGSIGGVIGTAIGAGAVIAASRRYHSFRALTVPFRAFLVASTGTFIGTSKPMTKWSHKLTLLQPSSPPTEPPPPTTSNTHQRRREPQSAKRSAKPSTKPTKLFTSAPKNGQPRTDTRCSSASGSPPWLARGIWSTATLT